MKAANFPHSADKILIELHYTSKLLRFVSFIYLNYGVILFSDPICHITCRPKMFSTSSCKWISSSKSFVEKFCYSFPTVRIVKHSFCAFSTRFSLCPVTQFSSFIFHLILHFECRNAFSPFSLIFLILDVV